MKKIGLLALGLALALGVVAEAGSIPADRVPLQTYAVKKMNCYLQPNGVQKGWIDPGDYVVVTQIRSDGWAYGSYPVGNGRVSRWFRADDLVNNIGFANQERYSPKANTNTYTGPDHSKKFGSFNDNETLLVVSESGESRQFIYKLNNGGYKMAWAPYWDCWDARQAGKQQVNNNEINKNSIVKPVQREDKKQEQTSYGVWKATARYTANTYNNPDLRGARAGWVTSGSDIEVLGENAKSYFIRYWADNGATRERYVERTAVKGLNEDKGSQQNTISSGVIRGVENATKLNATTQVKNRIYWMKSNLNGYKNGAKYTGLSYCRGFANKVYTYLFPGVQKISGHTNDNFGALRFEGSFKVARIADFAPDEVNTVKNFFRQAKPGYFVQMGRRYSTNSSGDAAKPHSAILAGVYDGGCDFYEANADNRNTIQLNWYTWARLAKMNKGYTLYAPNDYRLK